MRAAFFHRCWQGRPHQFATRAGLKSGLTIFLLLYLSQLAAAQGTFSPTGSMTEPRVYHRLTLLPDGRVLATGSRIFSNGTESATAELYNPATGTWSRTGSMTTARHRHTATLLKNGKVLVAGGSGGGSVLESAELYDPVTGTWSPTGSLLVGTDGHTAKLLQNGKVLVAGGGVPRAAQLYDPETGLWSPTGSMVQGRFTAGGDFGVVLNDGRVLVAGGIGAVSSEIYDPASGTWSATGSLTYPGGEWSAMNVLADGRVLISGGRAELYDPATGVWTPTPPPPRSVQYSATLLLDGTVFMAGGIPGQTPDDSLLYDPVLQTWTSLPGNSPEGNRAVRLLDGRVLVAGGVWSGTETTAAASSSPAG